MTDSDSELGDFDPQNDSGTEEQNDADADRELVGSKTPGRGVPELRKTRSEHQRNIRPGDVCRDIWGTAWVIAIQKKADTVAEYDQQQPDSKQSLLSYEGSIGVGATEEDAVWACFYINSNNTLAGGRSGPYDFPESRIVRYAYESTDGWEFGRFQDHIQMDVLERLVAQFPNFQGKEDESATLFEAISSEFGEGAAQEAFELAEASQGTEEDEDFFPADPAGDQ